jgi:endogenous inhibitor of DNA gyrase (YacG/DUF329 family)
VEAVLCWRAGSGIGKVSVGEETVLVRVKCPTCRVEVAWDGNPFRPFCSDRCKTLDLGAWMSEHYRIPGKEEDASGDPEASTSRSGGDTPDDDL